MGRQRRSQACAYQRSDSENKQPATQPLGIRPKFDHFETQTLPTSERLLIRSWSLVFGASLDLGSWSLELWSIWNLGFFWDLDFGIWNFISGHLRTSALPIPTPPATPLL